MNRTTEMQTTRNVQPVIENIGKEGSGELVSSRYAVRIGDVDVVLISDGLLPLPTTTMSTNVSDADRNQWFDNRFLQRDMFDWALNIALVRSGNRLILIDSGVGDGFEYFTRAGRSVMRLETAGIDLSAITDIVITHMHMDHVGGLNTDGVKAKLRPDVRIHVAAAEVEFWKNPDFSKTVMPETVPPALRKAAATFMQLYGENVVQFDQTVEVAPGVSARVTGGHTPGHCVVDVASNGEKLTFVGDAIFEVGFDHPEWQNGFEHDPEESTRVRIGLLNEAAETGSMLAAAHIAFPSIGHIAKNGNAFRFVPVLWDY
nr:MBL fold metallo-hydrolase [Cupriavidus pauculus]